MPREKEAYPAVERFLLILGLGIVSVFPKFSLILPFLIWAQMHDCHAAVPVYLSEK